MAVGRRLSSRSGFRAAFVFVALGVGCREGKTLEGDGTGAGAGDTGTSGTAGEPGVGGGSGGKGGTAGTAGVAAGRGGTTTGGAAGEPSTGGSGGAGPSLEEIATGEDEPFRVALDDRYVYWLTRNQLRRVALTGGEVTTLATGTGLRDLTVASEYVYFTDGIAGVLARVDREGGAVEELGGGTYPSGIFIHDAHVYWANTGMTAGSAPDGTLARVSLDGAGDVILAEGLHRPDAVVVDGEHVYYTSTSQGCGASSESPQTCWGGGVSSVPLDGGESTPLDDEGLPSDLVVGERGVYWVVTPGRVKFAPPDGADVELMTTLSGEDTGYLAVDADSLYFSSPTNGRVLRLPLDGGNPLPLVVDLGATGGIAVAGDWVYVTAMSEGRILRVKKDGSAGRPDGPITGPCPRPVGTADEIASTPREDTNLELLALALDFGEVVATDETYERVVADVARSRALVPSVADVPYRPHGDGKSLMVIPTEIGRQSMEAENYSAWDCLNDFYGLESGPEMSSAYAYLTLDGIYDMNLIADVYAQLPEVERVESSSGGSDGPTICAVRDGETIEYVIDRAGGDCPSGCTTHDAHYFRSTAPGVVEWVDSWATGNGATVPDWFTQLCPRG